MPSLPSPSAKTETPPAVRLLIVDDEVPVMTAIRDTLRDEGFDVVGASSGADALGLLQAGSFDALITDLMMPRMGGIELLEKALAIDTYLACIVMTGHGTVPTAVEAMKLGAVDYVLKPFKLSALRPVLSRALTIRNLRKKNVELETDLRAHADDLEAANKELEAFSYTISHDLRMPLRAINGFTELLQKHHTEEMTPQVRRYCELVRKGGLEMSRMIDAVLDFSRLGRHALSLRPVSLESLCREAYADLENERRDRQIELRVQPLPTVSADPVLLKGVFTNLLSNAIKYTRPRPQAIIEVGVAKSEPDGQHVIYVRDNGVGFDQNYANRLFQVFQRLHSLERFEGTGIGLATARRIVERHNGRIWGTSVLEAGATFYFSLPKAERGPA